MKVFFSIETVEGGSKFCKGSTILGVEYFQNIVIFKKKPYLQARVFPPK